MESASHNKEWLKTLRYILTFSDVLLYVSKGINLKTFVIVY